MGAPVKEHPLLLLQRQIRSAFQAVSFTLSGPGDHPRLKHMA